MRTISEPQEGLPADCADCADFPMQVPSTEGTEAHGRLPCRSVLSVDNNAAAFPRFFAFLGGRKAGVWARSGFLRCERGAKRSNRFKLYSLAFPGRGEAGCLYRKTRSGRRGGGCLYRFLRNNVLEPSFYIEKRVGSASDVFFYKVGGVPAFWMRLFIESPAIQRPGNVFL